MKKFIVVRLQFEAIHKWGKCPYEDVAFLRHPHRHIFYVEIKIPVTSSDREIEFIRFKRDVSSFIQSHFHMKNLGNMSCEMICERIIDKFNFIHTISVFEDNENGAVIEK